MLGVDAYLVRVETDVARGIPAFSTVGLPQIAVKEGRERVVAALKNAGFELPPRRITINLAPADVRKEGSAFDLPIAIGILAGTGQLEGSRAHGVAMVGELGLDGGLRPVRGALPIAAEARRAGLRALVLPRENAGEAALVEDLVVVPVRSLREVVHFLATGEHPPPVERSTEPAGHPDLLDFADVRGQAHSKRAIEIAAAGLHNILMIGPPGSGKTMLARRIPSILPELPIDEALETARIRSVAGVGDSTSLQRLPPFRAPHHTISDAGLAGGGRPPRPGEVSLAHNGVLFLDELPEFRRNVLEVLRQPLEDNRVTITRAGSTLAYPARFMLVAAMNPCPCGGYGDPRASCRCPPRVIQKYLGRISGPLLDRIDLHLEVPRLGAAELRLEKEREDSAAIQQRVLQARAIQERRFRDRPGVRANAHMEPSDLRRWCRTDRSGGALLRSAVDRLGLSARAYHRILKIGRTIADLEGEDAVRADHLAEAIQYRSLDRRAPAAV